METIKNSTKIEMLCELAHNRVLEEAKDNMIQIMIVIQIILKKMMEMDNILKMGKSYLMSITITMKV